MPKPVPSLVLDKVRQVFVSEVFNSNVLVQNVPNISLSQELNYVLFRSCCKDEHGKMGENTPFTRKCTLEPSETLERVMTNVCEHLWTISSYWTFCPLFRPTFSYQTKSQVTGCFR